MTQVRVLHLAIDEKFIDYAYLSFENVAPGCSEFWVFADSEHTYIKKTPHRKVRRRDRLSGRLARELAGYDLVLVHSLHPFWIPVINAAPKGVRFVWIGWGYDYYDLIYPDQDQLLLPATRALRNRVRGATAPAPAPSVPARVNRWLERLRLNPDKRRAISRIERFSPVLPEEYERVRSAFGTGPFPDQARWNYGSLEEVWVRDFLGRQFSGRNILIGNSASYTCNHLDLLQWLASRTQLLQGRELICPLSYGDKAYAKAIATAGTDLLPGQFRALMDFMPLSQYVDVISSCSHVLMNHVRQQGVGNLIIMLYLGATVVVREENPVLEYLRRIGFSVRSFQELDQQPELLDQGLSHEQIELQRELLQQHWSKLAIDRNSRELLVHTGLFTPA